MQNRFSLSLFCFYPFTNISIPIKIDRYRYTCFEISFHRFQIILTKTFTLVCHQKFLYQETQVQQSFCLKTCFISLVFSLTQFPSFALLNRQNLMRMSACQIIEILFSNIEPKSKTFLETSTFTNIIAYTDVWWNEIKC